MESRQHVGGDMWKWFFENRGGQQVDQQGQVTHPSKAMGSNGGAWSGAD
jgi:hypothetical protein